MQEEEEEKPLARRGLARPCRQLLRRRACTRTRVCVRAYGEALVTIYGLLLCCSPSSHSGRAMFKS